MSIKAGKIKVSIISLFVVILFVFWKDARILPGRKAAANKVKTENSWEKKSPAYNIASIIPEVLILQKWDLPAILKEVSGIAYIDEQRFACIQDEDGIIFIFNRVSKQIEKEIPFAGPGDYEDITINGNTAYVVRADGRIYELDMTVGKSSLKVYRTPLTIAQNVEGLCYDKSNDRLLLAIKDDEPGEPGYKGIYSFDLSKKTLVHPPVIKIDLKNEILNSSRDKKNKAIMPSSIAVHPLTNEIFITDGPKGNLLILDMSGKIKSLSSLGKNFSQPEGITFSPQGEIFISNEGNKKPGNILKIEMK